MKILNNYIHKIGLACAVVTLPMSYNALAQKIPADTFETTSVVTPKGTSDDLVLRKAPNPQITIAGKVQNAKLVVNLSENVLYKYDEDGIPQMAYKIASGKASTPTHKGIRIVSHIETYPYKGAPASSKRRRSPNDYGPKIIVVNIIDPKTGEQSSIGEFIHGTSAPSKLGQYVSHGCMRMDNDVIQILAKEVKRNDIVIIQ